MLLLSLIKRHSNFNLAITVVNHFGNTIVSMCTGQPGELCKVGLDKKELGKLKPSQIYTQYGM